MTVSLRNSSNDKKTGALLSKNYLARKRPREVAQCTSMMLTQLTRQMPNKLEVLYTTP